MTQKGSMGRFTVDHRITSDRNGRRPSVMTDALDKLGWHFLRDILAPFPGLAGIRHTHGGQGCQTIEGIGDGRPSNSRIRNG